MKLDKGEKEIYLSLLDEYLENLEQEYIIEVERIKLLMTELKNNSDINLRYYEEILDITKELRIRR